MGRGAAGDIDYDVHASCSAERDRPGPGRVRARRTRRAGRSASTPSSPRTSASPRRRRSGRTSCTRASTSTTRSLQDADLGFVVCLAAEPAAGRRVPMGRPWLLGGAAGLPDRRVPVLRPRLSGHERPCRARAADGCPAGPTSTSSRCPTLQSRRLRLWPRRVGARSRSSRRIEPDHPGATGHRRPAPCGAAARCLRAGSRRRDGRAEATGGTAPRDRLRLRRGRGAPSRPPDSVFDRHRRCSRAATSRRTTSNASSAADWRHVERDADGDAAVVLPRRARRTSSCGRRSSSRSGRPGTSCARAGDAPPDRRDAVGHGVDGRRVRLPAHDRQHVVQQAAERRPRTRSNVLKAGGQRIFVRDRARAGSCSALPSAFEMGPNHARWIYDDDRFTIAVRVETRPSTSRCSGSTPRSSAAGPSSCSITHDIVARHRTSSTPPAA